jgi:hypothetical protein
VIRVGLHTVDGEHNAIITSQRPSETLSVRGCESKEFVIAIEQVGDSTRGKADAPSTQFLVNFGETTLLGVAKPADEREDIEAKFALRQSEVRFGFRPVGQMKAAAKSVGATADLERESQHAIQGGNRAFIVVSGP